MMFRKICLKAFVVCMVGSFVGHSYAQTEAEATPKEIVLERISVTLQNPEDFQAFLSLTPITTVVLPAPADGTIGSVFVEKRNAPVKAQAEVVRLKSDERLIEQEIAEAELEYAKSQNNTALADFAAKKLKLAEYRVQQTIIRAPFDAEVGDIHVVPGQFVRAGEPLVTLIDPTKLIVEVPVDRTKVNPGDAITLTVERGQVQGIVEAIQPPIPELQPLRNLFLSLATARVVIDNKSGTYRPGQAVSSDMIPRHPIMEVAVSAIKNGVGGERKVQVIRDGFVKDLPVQLLGQVGETHVFVSARFAPQDELIVSASEDILDGSWVRPLLAGVTPKEPSQQSSRSAPAPKPGF